MWRIVSTFRLGPFFRTRCILTSHHEPHAGGNVQLETMYSERDERVATIVLNRPHVLNCANEQWARDLNTLVDDLAADNQLRVVVLRGAGRAFCSGIDLTALSLGEIGMTFYRNWETALRKLEALDAVVVAAIQSH